MPLDLTDTKDRQWQEVLNDYGSWSVTFPNEVEDSGVMISYPALGAVITPNTLVNFYLRGTLAATGFAEEFESTIVTQAEEAEQVTIWRGRLHSAVLDRAVFFPSLGVGRKPIEEDRSFNVFQIAFDDSALTPATFVMTVADAKVGGATVWGGGFIPWDAEFPDDTAEIIWGSFLTFPSIAAVGEVYGRQWITVPTAGKYTITVAADDAAEVYIDGALTVTTEGGTGHKVVFSDVDLSAGTHLVAWVCRNLPFIATQNYAGIAWVLERSAYPAMFVAHSIAADTLIADYPATVPGMTPGEAILIGLNEAQARGTITFVNPMFDGALDSAGNAWPVVADISTKVGTSLGTFLKELSGPYIDWYMPPGTWDLYCWIKGGRTTTPGVDFHRPTDPNDAASGNLAEFHRRGEAAITDDALVRWEGGWAERGDAGAIAANGRIEARLDTGALNSLGEVYRVADGELDEFATERVQTDIAIAPANDTEWPYLPGGWMVGDVITIEGNARRVLGVTVTEDNDTGRAIAVPTLNSNVVLGSVERTFQAIRKMINGTLGGRSRVAQPVVPQYVPRGLIGGMGADPDDPLPCFVDFVADLSGASADAAPGMTDFADDGVFENAILGGSYEVYWSSNIYNPGGAVNLRPTMTVAFGSPPSGPQVEEDDTYGSANGAPFGGAVTAATIFNSDDCYVELTVASAVTQSRGRRFQLFLSRGTFPTAPALVFEYRYWDGAGTDPYDETAPGGSGPYWVASVGRSHPHLSNVATTGFWPEADTTSVTGVDPLAPGDVLRFERFGGTLTGKLNGVTVVTGTGFTHPTNDLATHAGFTMNAESTRGHYDLPLEDIADGDLAISAFRAGPMEC